MSSLILLKLRAANANNVSHIGRYKKAFSGQYTAHRTYTTQYSVHGVCSTALTWQGDPKSADPDRVCYDLTAYTCTAAFVDDTFDWKIAVSDAQSLSMRGVTANAVLIDKLINPLVLLPVHRRKHQRQDHDSK